MKNLNIKEIINLGIVLGIISMVAAVLLGTTYSITKPAIEEQRKLAIIEAQKLIFPDAFSFSTLKDTKTDKELGNFKIGSTTINTVYEAKDKEGINIGYIVNAQTPGYSGNIVFVIGFTNDKKIMNIKVTEHTETPGLGANVAKRSFLDQFQKKSYSDPFVVKEDIKAVTSATISSKALVKGVKDVIDLMKDSNIGVNK